MKVLVIISIVSVSLIIALFFLLLGIIAVDNKSENAKGSAILCLFANTILIFVLVTLILCLTRL